MNKQSHFYIGRTIFIFANIILIFFLMRFFVIDISRVDGISMESTLTDNELIFINRFSLFFREPERQKIVQLIFPDDLETIQVKRIIGLPGDTIKIKKGAVYIIPETSNNNQEYLLQESYLDQNIKTYSANTSEYEIVVPEHAYFVLGDNRYKSVDSRDYGLVKRELILGEIITLPDFLK